MRAACVVPAMLVLAVPAAGQSADLGQALSGAHTPQSMQLRQFDATWTRITIRGSLANDGGQGDVLGKLAQIGMMAEGGKKAADGLGALSMLGGLGGDKPPVFFTQGKTISVGTETFLVAYGVEKSAPNLLQTIMQAQASGKEPDLSSLMSSGKWTEDTTATLALVNVRSIGVLAGVRPFDLPTEIAESEKGGMGLMELMLLGIASESKSPEPVPPKKPASTTRPATKTKPK